MRRFKNVNTGAELNEVDYVSMLIREYIEMWEDGDNLEANEFEYLSNWIKYMLDNDCDKDFELIED